MKIQLVLIILFLPVILFGQNKSITVGVKQNGVVIGNSKKCNGARVNFWDKNVDHVNGFSVALKASSLRTNGFSGALLMSGDSVTNGIKIAGFLTNSRDASGICIGGLGNAITNRANGLFICGLVNSIANSANGVCISGIGNVVTNRINGIGVSGVVTSANKMNGIFINGLGVGAISPVKSVSELNGIAIGIFTACDNLNGLSVGCISMVDTLNGCNIGLVYNESNSVSGTQIGLFNTTKDLHGIQIGLWNSAENKRCFRGTPFINFNFRRKQKKVK